MYFNLIKIMFSILRLFAGSIMESISNRFTNNKFLGKFTCTLMHQDLAVTLMNTPGHFISFKLTNPYYYLFPEPLLY